MRPIRVRKLTVLFTFYSPRSLELKAKDSVVRLLMCLRVMFVLTISYEWIYTYVCAHISVDLRQPGNTKCLYIYSCSGYANDLSQTLLNRRGWCWLRTASQRHRSGNVRNCARPSVSMCTYVYLQNHMLYGCVCMCRHTHQTRFMPSKTVGPISNTMVRGSYKLQVYCQVVAKSIWYIFASVYTHIGGHAFVWADSVDSETTTLAILFTHY